MARNRKKTIKPRFSDTALDKLEAAYLGQLPTVAALLAASTDEYDSVTIAQDAVELLDSIMLVLESQEAEGPDEEEIT